MAKKKVKRVVRAKKDCCDLNKMTKRMKWFDVSLVKLSSMAFILFVITLWPAALEFVLGISWGWWLAITIILALRPIKRALF